MLIIFFMHYVSRSPEVSSYLYELWLCIILQMVKTSANLLQCVSKCRYQFYGNYLNFWVSTRYSGIKNLARSMCGVAGSQPKFYDTIQSHTMVAANGVISEILTKLPGINDLSKLKVSAPVTWWYKVVEWSDCVHLSVNLIPKSTDYIKLKVLWWYMGHLDKPRWCREKCGVH